MATPAPRKHSRARRIFRWCRIVFLVAILLSVVAGIYLNHVGLPDFLKRPLLAKLRAEGIQMEFERMRLRWYRGIVVDTATFTFLKHPLQPKFYSGETELNLNYRSLLGSHLRLDSLAINNGRLLWLASKTNYLSLSNLTARVSFDAHETVRVPNFQADFIGTRLTLSGVITNASAVRDWKIFQPKKPDRPKRGLEKLVAALEKIHLSGHPELTLDISGDAADLKSVRGTLEFFVADAETPWGNGTNLKINGQWVDLLNSSENSFIQFKTDSAETRWGSGTNLNCFVKLVSTSANRESFQTELSVSAKQFRSDWGRADFAQFSGQSSQAWTNLVPKRLSGSVIATNAETKQGKSAFTEIVFTAATNNAAKVADDSWAAWRKIEPLHLTWELRAAKVQTPKIQVETVSCNGSWLAPDLKISNLNAELYGGGVQLTGQLNVVTREARARSTSDFDVQKISPFLTPFGQRWIGKYTWEKPPKTAGELQVTLPSWTNSSPNWRAEVLPTLWLDGSASVGRGSYRGVTANSASTTFTFSNMVWNLPHIRVDRPEGGADLNLVADDRTRGFRWRVHSQIDPKAIRHLLGEKQQVVFDYFHFTTPPSIRAELFGYWSAMEKISVAAEIAARNFAYRSNTIDKLNCSILFTNQNLRVTEGRLDKEDKFITAKKFEVDIPSQKIFFTDVYGTVDGHLVARMIGRKVAAHIAPYQFAEPPAVRLNGSMTINKHEEADMHFEVDGTRFRWKWFEADRIAGRLDWVGETLLVTNVLARAYGGGRIAGWSDFNFALTNGAEYRFDIAAADVDIQRFTKSFSGKTNHLEGMLHGQMTLNSGNTRDLKTMRGHGHVNLRDGLVWDVPVFGLFSPVLNAVVPGSGNSRAREASAKFTVRDGVIYSDDLEIRAPTVRLQYRGAVDFEHNLDARVEAELLRDAWVVGPIISLALTPLSKIFEYRVTGTLSKPESEPVYIPDFLMMTLRPFHSIKKAFTPEKEKPGSVPGTSAIPP